MSISIDQTHEWLSQLPLLYFFLPLVWLVFAIGLLVPVKRFGLVPRTAKGLWGIVAMPFLHEDYRHLISNSAPLVVLLVLLFNAPADPLATVVFIQVTGGFLLWIFGRTALHIGASVLVFGLAGFHLANGALEGRVLSIAIALLVATLYGSSFLASLNPWRKGSSWDGHLCGFIAGISAAFLLNN